VLNGERPDFFDRAACASGGTLTELFFPPSSPFGGKELRRGPSDDTLEAMAICGRCPVRQECLDYALSLPQRHDFGVWGGTNEGWRRQERKRRNGVT
jgi:hypothetical protein